MPRISLRDLFWLTLVVACICGWMIERRSLLSAKRVAEGDAQDLGRLTNPTFELAPWRLAELRKKYGIPE